MNRNPTLFEILWNRYCENTISPDDRYTFMQMVDSGLYDTDLKLLISKNKLQPAEVAEVDGSTSTNKDLVWENIQLHLQAPDDKIKQISPQRGKKVKWFIAAAVMIGLMIGVAVYYNNISRPTLEPAVSMMGTPYHQLKQLKILNGPQNYLLPDGSYIVLRENSTLKYDSLAFTNSRYRDVYMNGEIYFDVKHMESKPFVVHTDEVSTSVLGTSFNVLSMSNGNLRVAVLSGKVSVNKSGKTLGVLTPNRQLAFNKEKNQVSLHNVDASEETNWSKQFLIFQDLPLKDAIKLTEERFNVKINIPETTNNIRINARFTHKEDLHQVLEMLAVITDMQVSQRGASYEFTAI